MKKTLKLGLITDLHQDIMHDGEKRLGAFLEKMRALKPDALIQLGDFAVPSPQNKALIAQFNGAHPVALHVLGNHDTDGGYNKQQTIDAWGMPQRYYAHELSGLRLLVLDGNDKGSPTHRGGYPISVGPEQVEWLRAQLKSATGPVLVLSHQPLAGTGAVDNAHEVQQVLSEYADKVLLALNGHTHIDDIVRVAGVSYWHVNSASYYWVGDDYKHTSYSPEIHAKHPWIASTCPYRDPLFTLLTVELPHGKITLEGCESTWVGASPGELGVTKSLNLTDGEELAPRIRFRELRRCVA